jgi:DUF4097 and DUF4098 domain-containing protein YvlB
VVLSIEIAAGDVTIAYSRDGEVSIQASGLRAGEFEANLNIGQTQNQISIRPSASAHALSGPNIAYRIGVPNRIDVVANIGERGNITIIGIAGSARVSTGLGDIDVTYLSRGLLTAKSDRGRITCKRVDRVEAAVGEGNITLMESGDSTATVREGAGRIDIGGARSSVKAWTNAGELHIKAVPWGNWELSSKSGNIRAELPTKAAFELEMTTQSGLISVGRQDMESLAADTRKFHQMVNGGGKLIRAHTSSGSIRIE